MVVFKVQPRGTQRYSQYFNQSQSVGCCQSDWKTNPTWQKGNVPRADQCLSCIPSCTPGWLDDVTVRSHASDFMQVGALNRGSIRQIYQHILTPVDVWWHWSMWWDWDAEVVVPTHLRPEEFVQTKTLPPWSLSNIHSEVACFIERIPKRCPSASHLLVGINIGKISIKHYKI